MNPTVPMCRTLNPRLVGIRGPVEGGVFGLADDDLSIGSDASNQLRIDDPSIAARHCRIRRQKGEKFTIQELATCGATIVNGLPVTERVLQHGDEIRLGDCCFLFLRWDADLQVDVRLGDARPCDQPGRADCLYRMTAASLEKPAANCEAWCSLTTLLRVGASMQLARRAEEIAQQLLEGIFEAVPAQHGSLLLFDGQSPEPSFASHRDRETGPTTTVRTFGPIVDRARRDVTGILATDVLPDRPTVAAERLSDLQPRSVLAAPIVASARTLGVICLDSGISGLPFQEGHLELVSCLGAILGPTLENARHLEWLETENLRLQEAVGLDHDMVGASPCMRDVYQFVSKVAPMGSTVLIRGESGTGKELVARAIHRNSPRAGMPFLAINCAGLSETLMESELFGHEKGAFTGAFAQKRGKFELADRGTVFLDEVGEMPVACQAMLLRVIQEREFGRVGGTRPIRSDIRLIAATNRDLEAAIERGAFRRDLYYRLNVVSLTIPPLRDRREDIPLLARYFVLKHAKLAKRRVAGISREALACLEAHDWPGNVRDIENAIERAVVLGSTDLILTEDLPETVFESDSRGAGLIGGYLETIRNEKKRVILAALDQSAGSFTEAAKLLGIHSTYLHRLVRNLNLRGAIRNAAGA
jgi:transcriptional regulator with GAF, ATPase, and Fis domain